MNQSFPARFRLKAGHEFAAVYQARTTAGDGCLLVYGRPNEAGHSRLGLSVSRKVGKAVIRNRWKRLIREAFRTSADRLPTGLDLVVIPRAAEPPPQGAIRASLVKLSHDVRRRWQRSGPPAKPSTTADGEPKQGADSPSKTGSHGRSSGRPAKPRDAGSGSK